MKFALFYHSLVSDWNHGNAHFLRGLVRSLQELGHRVTIYEPENGWSRKNLLKLRGERAQQEFSRYFPSLFCTFYDLTTLNYEEVFEDTDVIIVHEWNEPELLSQLLRHRERSRKDCLILFHDTHHRAVSAPNEIQKFGVERCDAALVFGAVLKEVYHKYQIATPTFIWHEAADSELFRPLPSAERSGLVWVGNWGDDERTAELKEFLITPASQLCLPTTVYGVRYPEHAQKMLSRHPFSYRGYLPNYLAPVAYAHHQVTVHIPRRFYRELLPGIPTIRIFEALAAGIPLICAPWEDRESLFLNGSDYLLARDGKEMKELILAILEDPGLARSLAEHGRRTITAKHSCRIRALELLEICRKLGRQSEARCHFIPRLSLTEGASRRNLV